MSPFTQRALLGTRSAIVASSVVLISCGVGLGSVAHAAPEARVETATIALTPPRDADMEARLTGIFEQMDGLQGVHVRVRNGVVHLSGVTSTPSLEERATSTAERIEGVVYVRSDVSQPASPWGFLAPVGRTLVRMGRSVVDFVPKLVLAMAVFLPFFALSALVRRWRYPFRVFGVSRLSGSLLRVGLRTVLLVAGILAVLDVLGIMGAVGAVVGTLGVLGVVAGFVFKDSVSVYLPGLMLGLRPPFEAGDLVRIGEHEGRVAHITPSATVLVTTDGEELRIPNVEILKKPLVNLSLHRTRRLRFRVALASEANLAVSEDVARRALLAVRGVTHDPPPFMRVQVLGREEVDVEFFAWVDQDEANFRNVESRAKRAVLDALHERGVPLSALAIVLRQQARAESLETTRAGAPTAPEAEAEESSAESVDSAFVGRAFDEARARRSEPDLLEEEHRQ